MTFISLKKAQFGTHAFSANKLPTAEVILSPVNGEDGLPDSEFLVDNWINYSVEIRKSVGKLLYYLDYAMEYGQTAIIDYSFPVQVQIRLMNT